jgi:hypothetical protein
MTLKFKLRPNREIEMVVSRDTYPDIGGIALYKE